METKVKICGITRAEDAERAVSGGAWALGFIMWPDSPRYCAPEHVAQLAESFKRRVELVGVFVDASLDELAAAAEAIPFTMLQFHGDEGPAYCAEAARSTGLKIVKAMRVRDAASVRELRVFATDFHMLDAHIPGLPGGTGQSFEWSLAASHPTQPPLILSGGLRPDNVAEAISVAQPFAVDVSSGIEASPGIKEAGLLNSFLEAVRGTAVAV